MNLFSGIFNWAMDGLRRSIGVQSPLPNSYSTASASPVTYDSAMQLSAVWACVKLLAETAASLPLTIYKKEENGREEAKEHPLTQLFNGKVNRYQTKNEFFETLFLNLIVHGNAYVLIDKLGNRIVSLLPLMSSQITVEMLSDGELVYQYIQENGNVVVLSTARVWHLKLMGSGTIGMSPLAYQRNSLGIAQAAESAVTKIYSNGAKPSGVLTVDKFLTPAQRSEVRASFSDLTSSNNDRLLVLEGGFKFNQVSLSPQDIELLASRKFQIAEICRWYGVPSVMVNDNNGTSVWGTGIEQIMQGFYKLTMRPLLEKVEQSMKVHLASLIERDSIEFEFNFDALLRADIKSRFEAYRVGIASGVMTPNEARELENLEAKDGGDQLYMQGAMMPIANNEEQNNNEIEHPDKPEMDDLTFKGNKK